MIVASRRICGGIGVLVLCQAAAWAQSPPLVGDAFFNPGAANNFGTTVNINVGGAAGSQGLAQFDLDQASGRHCGKQCHDSDLATFCQQGFGSGGCQCLRGGLELV
jgi:hypothetical protein